MVAHCRPGPAGASAWNRAAGEGLAIADVTSGGGTTYFDGQGHLAPARAYDKSELAGYVEYGATDWLMLVARPSFDRIAIGEPGQGLYSGLGAVAAGAQVQALVFGPAVLAVQGSFSLPGSTSRKDPALVGNTAREGEMRVLGGIGVERGGVTMFLDAQQAFRVRSSGAAAEWHSDLTFGVRPAPRLLVMLQSETVVPTGPGTAWLPGARSSKLGLTGVYDLTRAVSIELGLFTTVWGRDALRERGFRTGFWYRF